MYNPFANKSFIPHVKFIVLLPKNRLSHMFFFAHVQQIVYCQKNCLSHVYTATLAGCVRGNCKMRRRCMFTRLNYYYYSIQF